MQMPQIAAIDLRKPLVPEQYTQLYYTPIYRGLHYEHRLRYNQLFGVRINEYIMMLEADLVERLLAPLRHHRNVAGNAALVRCIDIMIEEERQHYHCFAALNRACFPAAIREQRALLLRSAMDDTRDCSRPSGSSRAGLPSRSGTSWPWRNHQPRWRAT